MKKDSVSQEDLYVVVSYGYHGDPGSDGNVYLTKEAAQKVCDQVNTRYPNLRYRVIDLQDYIWECRDWRGHDCEIC